MPSVLVARKFDNFSRILRENGFSVINCPTIETAALEDLSDLDAKISRMESFDGVFLTSRAAAEIFRDRVAAAGGVRRVRVYVLGRSSFDLLKGENLDLIFDPQANTAREMLDAIPRPDLAGRRFLFVRGERSLRAVPDYLNAVATVEETIVYRTRAVAQDSRTIRDIRTKAVGGEILCACFFSPSGAESFLQQFGGEILHRTKTAVIGETTAEFLRGHNYLVDFVSPRSTAEDFAAGLLEFLRASGSGSRR